MTERLPSLIRQALARGDVEAGLDLLSAGLPGQPGNATRKNYLSSLRAYLRWAGEEDRSVLNATAADAQAYFGRLLQKHAQTPSTIHNHLTRVRTMYDLLREHGLHPGPNPFLGLKLPSNKPEEHRDLYSEAEITRLLAHADVAGRALVLLGARAGLTGPETVAQRWEDVDLRGGRLLAPGRELELDAELQEALEAYGRERGQTALFSAPGPLFEFQTDHQLRAAIYALCQRANVPYRAWRALRNTAGMRVLQQTGDPQEVARRLGLTTLKAVEVWQKLEAEGA
ncbi:tyrosine-type recombinase/integrase [Deinococcus hopiensis]|uniref:Integrase/recombinase XerD n=1 Tax=Deinococcus hopiensis KR-140 TaxID=695939 RepID=A0A1W1UHC4_9DEIO|nr:site-specific integrase [Deinococcus hopiensis]SMB80174.1 integrase/recombinase XerD [Deinococcus hopiensis KR-140]